MHISAERIAQIEARRDEVQASMTRADLPPEEFVRLSKEYAEIEPVARAAHEVRRLRQELKALEYMAGGEDADADAAMREMAQDEMRLIKGQLPEAERALALQLLPRDSADARPAMLEIRAGTGGDEAALFAGDLFRMYQRYADAQGWKVEMISANAAEVGGFKEVVASVTGTGVFAKFKFESGVHRVQRVPVTESQGRIHTSACTVAVMAEADEVGDVQVSPDELRIDVYRASGAGGQHVNKTESAVRITHLPTGIVAECQDDRSQHRNRDKAMKVLLTRLRDAQERELHAKEAAHRKSLVGSGDRSERIRTYNFPQGRVTDHRINLTLYKLQAMMDGDLDELTDALVQAQIAEQAAALEESA